MGLDRPALLHSAIYIDPYGAFLGFLALTERVLHLEVVFGAPAENTGPGLCQE